ncbi:MAG: acyl--CoA ligase, partial [Alphaproteobacteria bacterium]|nr:acyl--CoA ligase [Alphaproteobacteria bacterium]
MANEQDERFDRIVAGLTAPGGRFPVAMMDVAGISLPYVASAPQHLVALFDLCAGLYAQNEAIIDGAQRLTFATINTQASVLARAMIYKFGIKKGERIALAARNSAAWIVAYMAILKAGGVATLVNGFWEGAEMAAALEDVGAVLVLADGPRAARLAGDFFSESIRLICFDDSAPISEVFATLHEGVTGEVALPQISGGDLATILFTSGSTGQSKGAYCTHRAKVQGIFSYLIQTSTMLQYVTEEGRAPKYPPSTLMNVPLFHITGELTVFLQGLLMGRKLVMIPKWDARDAMRLIEAERITYFTGVPLMSYEILMHPERAQFDLSSCLAFAAGGAPRPAEHVKSFHAGLPASEPILGYGLTETNAVGAANFGPNYSAKPGSTGRAQKPLVDIVILDDTGTPLPPGERGEIGIRSIANFSGYWHNDAATRAAITPDGFFRTGDIGFLDDENYLYIVDRKKDIIIRGGENITSLEVEAALYACPNVAEACVFGLPDARYGEVPGAVIYGNTNETDVLEQIKSRLAPFKIPVKIWVSETQLPRLGTGKIDKKLLREQYR